MQQSRRTEYIFFEGFRAAVFRSFTSAEKFIEALCAIGVSFMLRIGKATKRKPARYIVLFVGT